MSMLSLSVGEMIHVLEYILNDPKVRTAVDQEPMLHLMTPELKTTLDALQNTRSQPVVGQLSATAEKSIREKLQVLDDEHDKLNHIAYHLLSLTHKHGSSDLLRTQTGSLLDALFPHKLAVVKMKWVNEVGEARRLAQQIKDTEVQQILASVGITMGPDQFSVLDLLQNMVAVADQMNTLLLQLHSADGTAPAGLQEARKRFFKYVGWFASSVELVFEQKPETAELVLRALTQKTQEAAKRLQANAASKPAQTSSPDPTQTNAPSGSVPPANVPSGSAQTGVSPDPKPPTGTP